MSRLREPAPVDFLARRLGAIAWQGPPPAEGSRRWLVETCRAELEWAAARWRALDPAAHDRASRAPARTGWDDPHPAEAWRLAHEHEAARLVNAHLHLDSELCRIRTLLLRLPLQRHAAGQATQDGRLREQWRVATEDSIGELRERLRRRRIAWRLFLQAASNYRRLRARLATLREAPGEAGRRAA